MTGEWSGLSLFLVGWLGGVHCIGMCGGMVAAMSLSSIGGRAGIGTLLGYNVGRVTSYVIAGALAGAIGASTLLLNGFFPVERVLYGLSNVMLILLGLYLGGWSHAVLWFEKQGSALWRRVQPLLKNVLPVRGVRQAWLAGLIWGWLPCGLVYSVLVTALASGSAWHGAWDMLAFGAGTLPNLLAMGWFARRLQGFRQQPAVRYLAGVLVMGFGVWGLSHLLMGAGGRI